LTTLTETLPPAKHLKRRTAATLAIRVDPPEVIGYDCAVMKQAIHPEVFETAVHCNGCDTKFTLHTTVKTIDVEICSNCHPFYTGKQKLLDTAGRVDRFKARKAAGTKAAEVKAALQNKKDAKLAEIQDELQSETVDAAQTKA